MQKCYDFIQNSIELNIANSGSPFVWVEHDNAVWECDCKDIVRLGVVWDGVQFLASLHEDHTQRRLTVSEAMLVFVVEQVNTIGCLRENTPTSTPCTLQHLECVLN